MKKCLSLLQNPWPYPSSKSTKRPTFRQTSAKTLPRMSWSTWINTHLQPYSKESKNPICTFPNPLFKFSVLVFLCEISWNLDLFLDFGLHMLSVGKLNCFLYRAQFLLFLSIFEQKSFCFYSPIYGLQNFVVHSFYAQLINAYISTIKFMIKNHTVLATIKGLFFRTILSTPLANLRRLIRCLQYFISWV